MPQETTTPDDKPVIDQVRDVIREGTEETWAMNRQVLKAWVAGTEATLKASIDLQNAAIASGRSLLEAATTGTNRTLFDQWAKTVLMAQKATLEALDVSKRIGEQFSPKTESK